jgi:hypothetical protein
VIISAVAVGLMAASMTSLARAGGAAVRFAQLDVVITRAVSQNGYPFVRWKLGAGWCSNVVEVASDPTVGDDGSFLDEHLVDNDVLDDAETSWLSSSPSTANPGSYYVHIQVVSCDFSADAEWSAIVKFDFPASSPAPPPPAPKPALPPPPNPNPQPPPTPSPRPTPNPASRMVLTLRDLPRGFRATKRRSYPTAASVAAGSRTTTTADYKKWGYVTGYEADFSREVSLSDVAKGAIRIGSTASI